MRKLKIGTLALIVIFAVVSPVDSIPAAEKAKEVAPAQAIPLSLVMIGD